MGGVRDDEDPLAELRRRLAQGLALSRLTGKKQLGELAGVGRTTVHDVFRADGPLPSEHTVAALGRELRLPVGELLELRRAAADRSGAPSGDTSAPGKPVAAWEPHDLEVHPASPDPTVRGSGTSVRRVLPGYVPRAHDQVLAEAVADASGGRSRMLVLVGTSSTGKTRACWEAVQPLADRGWRLWHPFDPTRAEAALEDLHRVGPRTVVWLNEAQHYLGNRAAGERIAAALHHLLVTPERGPVLVLGTLWPEYAAQYTTLPAPVGEDPHSRVRELLSGRTVTVPDSFDARALATAAALAQGGDGLLADALTRARTDGRVTQDLAGAPELLIRYQHASPAAKALLEAAMDARRLGVGLYLPQPFLTDAAIDYLSDSDYADLPDDWAEAAYAELAKPVHGKQAPLPRVSPRPVHRAPSSPTASPALAMFASLVFRLADYLEQHGRTVRRALCPPASFWNAAHTHLSDPDDVNNLADAANSRYRFQWAHHLRCQAARAGSPSALAVLAEVLDEAGDPCGAESLAWRATDAGQTGALVGLARRRVQAGDREGAEALCERAAHAGSSDVLVRLARWREEAGDREGAEALCERAAHAGSSDALVRLARWREEAGDREGAEALYERAAHAGSSDALVRLARWREKDDDREGAEALYERAAHAGSSDALAGLALMRVQAGDHDGAEALAMRAADRGSSYALLRLVELREEAGDRGGAEGLAQRAADAGHVGVLVALAVLRVQAEDPDGAEGLAQRAADAGRLDVWSTFAWLRDLHWDDEGAKALYRRAADAGDFDALVRIAQLQDRTGDHDGAQATYCQAADRGHPAALVHLARMREESGDRDRAEVLYRLAADTGFAYMNPTGAGIHARWPDGLDPNGKPSQPWDRTELPTNLLNSGRSG